MNLNFTKNKCVPRGRIKQILLIMRLTTFILFAAFMQVSAAGLAQRLTLVQKSVTLKQVFNEVNKQTGYSIVWSVSQVRGSVQVDVDFKDTPLLEALDKCLENTNLTYTIENKTVVIRERELPLVDKIKSALHIAVTVSGKVVDETGQPLPGVTVRQKETNNLVVTDAKGAFSISVPDDKAVIAFSFVGFETQELMAKDISEGSVIRMKAADNNLREVVINKGYYNEKHEFSTGDISIVSGRTINQQPVNDPILALEGRVPGLYLAQFSGVPGQTLNVIRLRGQNSISNGNNPFFIVDGIPFDAQSLTSTYFGGGAAFLSPFVTISPSDIESIEVLKDADATAIYGSRGANGVILITTKKGKPGDTQIDVNLTGGSGKVTNRLNLLNTQQYLQMRHEAFLNDGVSPSVRDYDINGTWDTTRYTDWQKLLIGNSAKYEKADMSISGGNSNTQFLLGGSYNKQTTVFPGNYNDRLGSAHMSLNHRSANQKFHTTFSASYASDISNLPTVDLTSLILMAPDAPAIYSNDGSLNWQNNTWANPFAKLNTNAKSVTNDLQSNFQVSYEIFKDLKLSGNFNYSTIRMDQLITTPITAYPPAYSSFSVLRSNHTANNLIKTLNIEPQINYARKIGEGQIEILIGSTFQTNNQNILGISGSNFSSDDLLNNLVSAGTIKVTQNSITDYRYNAIFGRLGFNLQSKYIINVTARRDGSSRFGPGYQFGNFGSIGTAWIFSKEKFIQDKLTFLSLGKIKASYGTTGNDQISDYQYLSNYAAYSYPYQGLGGLYPTNISNPYYHWEVVKKMELSLEFGFFDNDILFNANYYRNRTGNELVGYALPNITGFQKVTANLPAIIQNDGFEFEINSSNIKSTNFAWNSSINLSVPRNKLIAYPDLSGSSYANQYEVGKSLFIKKLYQYNGLNSQTGVYNFTDINSDGTISNPDDLVANKQVAQSFFGGFLNSFIYKRFQLDVFLQFVKQTGYSGNFIYSLPGFVNANQPINVLNHWKKSGNSAIFEKLTQSGGTDAGQAYSLLSQSDYFIGDASFIRVKNISFSYELPLVTEKILRAKKIRLYLQGQNLFTITGYKGLDPETQGLQLPPLRLITGGIQVTF